MKDIVVVTGGGHIPSFHAGMHGVYDEAKKITIEFLAQLAVMKASERTIILN